MSLRNHRYCFKILRENIFSSKNSNFYPVFLSTLNDFLFKTDKFQFLMAIQGLLWKYRKKETCSLVANYFSNVLLKLYINPFRGMIFFSQLVWKPPHFGFEWETFTFVNSCSRKWADGNLQKRSCCFFRICFFPLIGEGEGANLPNMICFWPFSA